jgi:hypothetical protein
MVPTKHSHYPETMSGEKCIKNDYTLAKEIHEKLKYKWKEKKANLIREPPHST